MKDLVKAMVSDNLNEIEPSGNEAVIMGSALILFNVLLMFCLSIYWINPSVHQYISGKPL